MFPPRCTAVAPVNLTVWISLASPIAAVITVPPVISTVSAEFAVIAVIVTSPVPASIVKLAPLSRATPPPTKVKASSSVLMVCAALISIISTVVAVVNVVAPSIL